MPRQPLNAQFRRGGIALPKSFKCATCNLWKPTAEFSQNQRSRWAQVKESKDDGITPESIGLTCKAHNNIEPQVKCAGPCGQSMGKTHFSKAQRNKPHAWCKICTEWKLRWPGDEAPDVAPSEGVLVDGINGEVITRANYAGRAGRNIYEVDDDDSDDDFDDDVSACSSDVSEDDADLDANEEDGESSEDDEDDDEDAYDDDHEEHDGNDLTSVMSAYQSTVLGHEHDGQSQDENVSRTISTSGLSRALLTPSSTNTTQALLSSDGTMAVPPHLRPCTSSRGITGYTSKASSGIAPSRLSGTSSGFHEEARTSTKSAAPSQGTAGYQPNLHNAAAFIPQADAATRTTYSVCQDNGPTVSTTASTTSRGRSSRFYKGDKRSIFHAPRRFTPLPIADTEPLPHIEEPEYSGDSSDDF